MLGTFGYAAAYMQGWVGQRSASTASSCPAPAPTVPAPKPQQIELNVYNATDQQGRATVVAKALHKRDFVIKHGGQRPDVQLRAGARGGALRDQGRGRGRLVVAGQVKGAKLVPDTRTDRWVDLVIGETFTQLVPQPPKPPAPAPA